MMVEEILQLQQIFPSWDRNTLASILAANGMNMDRAVETILSMEADGGAPPIEPEQAPAPLPTTPARSTAQQTPAVLPPSSFSPDEFEGPDVSEYYRGIQINLPDDFLRVTLE